MTILDRKLQRGADEIEYRLMNQTLDFSAAYMAVKSIFERVERADGRITDETVRALVFLIRSKKFDSQKQVLFLFRETADTLIAILHSDPSCAGECIIPELQKILISSTGHRQRAVGEALGSLPLTIEPVEEPIACNPLMSKRSFEWITKELDIDGTAQFTWRGRSLTAPTRTEQIGVIKFLNAHGNPENLAVETGWLDFFRAHAQSDFTDFDIPRPLKDGAAQMFKVVEIPDFIVLPPTVHERQIAIVFCVSPNYYDYPNEPLHREVNHRESNQGTFLDLPQVLGRNARLLGMATAMGIVHTAVIPLFHNRVQQGRREDGGIYQWERSGRLDRWLESCRHPNFATSGLRDFEHFAFVAGTKKLHHYIGSHLLSLVLVAGSSFRNSSPQKRGSDALGCPVDARDLFDPKEFKRAITCTINEYYSGFTGVEAPPPLFPPPSGELIDSLIDEMGVDRHMEEILRVEDQERMDEDQFLSFLLDRGVSPDEASHHERGKANISLSTGPHLGGFNRQISVPKLIDHIFSWASLCICGRFLQQKNHLSTLSRSPG